MCSSTSAFRGQLAAYAWAFLLCFLVWQQPHAVHADPPEPNQTTDVTDPPAETPAVASQPETAQPETAEAEPEAAEAAEAAAESVVAYSNYFDAYQAAADAQKDLLL